MLTGAEIDMSGLVVAERVIEPALEGGVIGWLFSELLVDIVDGGSVQPGGRELRARTESSYSFPRWLCREVAYKVVLRFHSV